MDRFMKREFLVKWAPLLVLFILILFFTLVEPRFLSVRNFARIAIASTPPLMVAVGVTFIIIMGSIDLSMEGTVSVTAVIFAFVFIGMGGTLASWAWLALPLALVVGSIVGFVNGLVHVKLKVPSFMASLAMGFVGTGFALLLTGGDRIRVEDEIFRALLTERWFSFPIMVYVAGLFLLIAWFIQSRTTLGRNFYAVGGGEELAHSSGLNVNRVRILGFTGGDPLRSRRDSGGGPYRHCGNSNRQQFYVCCHYVCRCWRYGALGRYRWCLEHVDWCTDRECH